MEAVRQNVRVQYEVPPANPDWTIPEETMPESQPHDLVLDLLKAILLARVASTKMNAQVARNLAIRFSKASPQIGVDPDLCLLSPRTPEGDELQSLLLWREGHAPPLVSIEVVSTTNARKDYTTAPDRYAASGTRELWIFDPALAGPKSHGGPLRLQVWRRDAEDNFARVHAGDGPAYSEALGGWLVVVHEGARLRIADDKDGTRFWPTAEEAERAAKEAERAAKDAALTRVAELEAELAKLRG